MNMVRTFYCEHCGCILSVAEVSMAEKYVGTKFGKMLCERCRGELGLMPDGEQN